MNKMKKTIAVIGATGSQGKGVVNTLVNEGSFNVLIAMVRGTRAEAVTIILQKIPLKLRNKVKEVTLDMAGNMGLITKQSFPNAVQVIDRFHVQKLALDALQEIRI